MVVLDGVVVEALQLAEQVGDRRGRGRVRPDRDGVDQQADQRVRPGRSTERPDTAVPKATSCWPVNEVSSCAQAACSTVLIVVRCERASSPPRG